MNGDADDQRSTTDAAKGAPTSLPPRTRPPPRFSLALAERCMDARVREAVIGDLLEEFDTRRQKANGDMRARYWFRYQLAIAVIRYPHRPRVRSAQGEGAVMGFVSDLARAVRLLRRAPTFVMLSAMTLGIGIGAATTIFSVADPVLLRPLPYGAPELLFAAWEFDDQRGRSPLGYATYADIASSSNSFEFTAALANWSPTVRREDSAERLNGLTVSWAYFRTLGVHVALGNDFRREDDTPATRNAVILSYALWQSGFRGDSSVIGAFANIDGKPMRVVGVMSASYDDVLSPGAQIWRVLGYDVSLGYACRTCHHLRMIARLKQGVAESTARAELNVISARLARDYPQDYPIPGMQLVSVQDDVTSAIRPALTALLLAVGLLLLIALVNVSGFQVSRAVSREEEFAVRVALGADLRRLTRQLIAEGLVLAALSWLVALAFAHFGVSLLVARLPASIPRLASVHVDGRAFGVASLVAIAAGIVIGLAPAWHARRRSWTGTLRGGRSLLGGAHRLRSVLVVTQIAIAVMLLGGAGQLARSVQRLLATDVGASLANVATTQVQVSGSRYDSMRAVLAWQQQLVEAVRAIPGVQQVAMANQLPLGGNIDAYSVQAQDKPLAKPELAPDADRYTVSTEYLATMQIPVLEGRDFASADNGESAEHVAIVSRALARQIWGSESAIGKRVHVGEASQPWYTVVGVAGDVRGRGLDNDATMQLYVPTRRWFFADNSVDVVVRTTGEPKLVLAALRQAVLVPDRGAVVTRLSTMDDVLAQSTSQRTLALTLLGVFAAIALFLSATGMFGALSGMVRERWRELALRSALGATSRDLVGAVLSQGLKFAGGGALIGVAGSLAVSRVVETLLLGSDAADAASILAIGCIMVLTAVLASAIPAWRASQLDPMSALRSA